MAGDQMSAIGQTIVTTIYAPHAALEEAALASLIATDTEFPTDRRIAGIDMGTEMIRDYVLQFDKPWCQDPWEVIEPKDGAPPRMGRMLKMALDRCETALIWTIEQDVEVHAGARRLLPAILDIHPELACVEALTVNESGAPHYPFTRKQYRRIGPTGDGLMRSIHHASLCCVCWRTEALRAVDWLRIPNYPGVDKTVSGQLKRQGWQMAVSLKATARHRFGEVPWSRRFLPAGWEANVETAV